MKYLLSVFLLLFTASLPATDRVEKPAATGRVVLEWAGQPLGIMARPPQNEVFMISRRGGKPLIVDAQSAQPSPFPDAIPALTVQTGETKTGEENVTLVVNPFRDMSPPTKGWVELDVTVENHLMVVAFTVNATADNPAAKVADTPADGGLLLCTLFLRGEDKPIILLSKQPEADKPMRTPLSGKLSPGAPQTLRIEWDWESGQSGMYFYLNGEPLELKENQRLFSVDPDKIGKGFNSLSVSLSGKGTFLGRIRASE